jgi:hypothetical protein
VTLMLAALTASGDGREVTAADIRTGLGKINDPACFLCLEMTHQLVERPFQPSSWPRQVSSLNSAEWVSVSSVPSGIGAGRSPRAAWRG